MRNRISVAALLAMALGWAALASPSSGHQGHAHVPEVKERVTQPSADQAPELPADLAKALPFPTDIGGDFDLVDQTGTPRRLKDFAGTPLAIFFGYAKCEAICSVAIPRMVEMVDALKERNVDVQPVLITVDPKRDTPAAMREALPKYHERLIGLTGSRAQIDVAQKAFQVESKVVYVDPDGGEIFAHGSYIYLMGTDGKFLTLFPPILGPERMATIAEKYLKPPRS